MKSAPLELKSLVGKIRGTSKMSFDGLEYRMAYFIAKPHLRASFLYALRTSSLLASRSIPRTTAASAACHTRGLVQPEREVDQGREAHWVSERRAYVLEDLSPALMAVLTVQHGPPNAQLASHLSATAAAPIHIKGQSSS